MNLDPDDCIYFRVELLWPAKSLNSNRVFLYHLGAAVERLCRQVLKQLLQHRGITKSDRLHNSLHLSLALFCRRLENFFGSWSYDICQCNSSDIKGEATERSKPDLHELLRLDSTSEAAKCLRRLWPSAFRSVTKAVVALILPSMSLPKRTIMCELRVFRRTLRQRYPPAREGFSGRASVVFAG